MKVSIDICLDGDVPLSSSLIRVDDDAGYLKVSIYICIDGDVPLSSSLIRVDDEVCLNPYEHLGIQIFYNHFTHIFLMVMLDSFETQTKRYGTKNIRGLRGKSSQLHQKKKV